MTPTEQPMDGLNGTYSICGRCGRLYGLDFKKAMGMWYDVCAICGEYTGVANALHDFGLSNGEVKRLREQVGVR
jgi:hypothetical protein